MILVFSDGSGETKCLGGAPALRAEVFNAYDNTISRSIPTLPDFHLHVQGISLPPTQPQETRQFREAHHNSRRSCLPLFHNGPVCGLFTQKHLEFLRRYRLVEYISLHNTATFLLQEGKRMNERSTFN